MPNWTPDPSFYPSPRTAMKAAPETLAYVAAFDPNGKTPDAIAVVEAHSSLLRELVGNLVENALKYSPPGTPVVLRPTAGGGAVTLAVEDRGPGIPPADRTRVLERFERGRPAPGGSDPGGSGLGLTIARQVALAHGGSVTIVLTCTVN